jgi:hypothetical protein
MIQKIFFILLLFVSNASYAQNEVDTIITPIADTSAVTQSINSDTLQAVYSDSVAVIKKQFDSFEYGEVIKNANRLLTWRDSISNDNLIQIFRMKGISHFSLTEDQAAKESFTEILKIDTSFVMDSAKTSPKIISLFNDVKKEYLFNLQAKEENIVIKTDTVYIPTKYPTSEIENHMRKTFLYSIFYPGAGHFYDNRSTKGWILSALTTISLGSFIFHIFEADIKEAKYLDERNPVMIDARYTSYNNSYRIRNISLFTLAAVWLYSQLDLLWFSDTDFGNLEIFSEDNESANPTFKLNFQINF